MHPIPAPPRDAYLSFTCLTFGDLRTTVLEKTMCSVSHQTQHTSNITHKKHRADRKRKQANKPTNKINGRNAPTLFLLRFSCMLLNTELRTTSTACGSGKTLGSLSRYKPYKPHTSSRKPSTGQNHNEQNILPGSLERGHFQTLNPLLQPDRSPGQKWLRT